MILQQIAVLMFACELLLGAASLRAASAPTSAPADPYEQRATPTAQSSKGGLFGMAIPYRAIDGKSDVPFHCWMSEPYGGGTKDAPKDTWWMVELPKKIRVQGAKIIGDTRGGIPIQRNFRVEWRDGEIWKTAGEVKGASNNVSTVTWAQPVETDALRVYFPAKDSPQQVRIVEFIPILAGGGEKTIPEILGMTPYQATLPYPGPDFPLAKDAGLPDFKYQGVALDYKGLKFNPHNDIIFPSVIRTDKLPNPLGRYYMYYAPHSAPGGICLAYADSPEGPWKEYPSNPVVSNNWPPNYSVSHVSGPDMVWIEEEKKYFLYFHGENTTTRFASSTDGLHFNYEGVCWTDTMFSSPGSTVGEASYARIYRYTIPGKDNRYIAIFMGVHNRKNRKVFLATSKDGRTWEPRKEPVVAPPPGTCQIAGNWYLPWNGKHYIIYHGHWTVNITVADLLVSEVDPTFEHSKFVGLLVDHKAAGTWNEAAMSPCMFQENGKLYLYYNIGPRLHQKIALAIASGAQGK